MDGLLDPLRELVAEWLTNWSVSQDGSRVRLGLADGEGRPCRVDLPMEAVSGLLLTLPRILQCALDARGDSSGRIVHPLGAWRLEQAGADRGLILTLETADGFSVAFALTPGDLAAMTEPAHDHAPAPASAARMLN